MRECALTDERKRQMCERREITARADASLLRNRRMQLRVQHRNEQLGEIRARTGVPFGNDVRAKQHHRADFAFGEEWSDASGVTAHKIHLQLGETLVRNDDIGEFAEPGRDAVRGGVPRDEIIDDATGGARTLARHRRQLHRRLAGGYGEYVLDAERSSIDHDRRHGVNVAGRKSRFKGYSARVSARHCLPHSDTTNRIRRSSARCRQHAPRRSARRRSCAC